MPINEYHGGAIKWKVNDSPGFVAHVGETFGEDNDTVYWANFKQLNSSFAPFTICHDAITAVPKRPYKNACKGGYPQIKNPKMYSDEDGEMYCFFTIPNHEKIGFKAEKTGDPYTFYKVLAEEKCGDLSSLLPHITTKLIKQNRNRTEQNRD